MRRRLTFQRMTFSFFRPGVVGLALAGLLLLGLTGWWLRPALVPPAARAATTRPAPPTFRGVSWVAGDSIAAPDLAPLLRCHVSWIAQTPFGWADSAAAPVVRLHTGRTGRWGLWGETDAGLVHTALLARQQGICTLLKPHLWVRGGRGASSWPGDIAMRSAADWAAWFASYSAFILHYAALAEANHLDALCLGTELQHATAPAHEAAWRALIGRVRAVYHGPLTYAANWSGEYEQIRFWDALDYIGIQAYFPLSTTDSPDKAALLAAWQRHLPAIERVQRRFGKPVVFTEVGYRNAPDAAIEPWKWPERTAVVLPTSETLQMACYEAMFETFWARPWFAGLFVWKWYPRLAPDDPGRRPLDFTPQHKPAEQVMARWFSH